MDFQLADDDHEILKLTPLLVQKLTLPEAYLILKYAFVSLQ